MYSGTFLTALSLEDHVQHVRAVLLYLSTFVVFVKAEKWDLQSLSVSFLGYWISPENVWVDPANVSTVLSWP